MPQSRLFRSAVFVVLGILQLPVAADALTLQDVKDALMRHRGRWTAKENPVSALSPGERRRRLGETSTDDGLHFEVPPETRPALPAHFDWRDRNGISYASPVLDQGRCGSCVIFATIGTLETQMNVTRNTPDSPWNFSTQHLLSCGGSTCESGWNAGSAASFLQRYGVPDAACFPYTSGSTGQDVACKLTCADSSRRSMRIARYSTPTMSTVNVAAVKRAVLQGPVLTTMTVYEDFFFFNDGVYHHVTGASVAGHAVSIVGWDDEERAWIVRNSWGRNWGDAGFFKIAWNDVSGVGRSTWSLDVGQVDGFVTFGGQHNPAVIAGKTSLPLRSTFRDLVRIEWSVLKNGVPVAEGSAPTSADVAVDTTTLPDGTYELRATAVRKSSRVNAQPRAAYVLNGKLEGEASLSNLTAGQTLSGKVTIGVQLKLGPVPFTQVTFHAKNLETGAVTKKSTTSISPYVNLSWRTNAQPNGEYEVWLEASAGDVASITTAPLRIVLAN